ncbi:MAG: hypothetical protein Q8R92_08890 [Deltaproteobacteria bacterium]|nr:hypothetical protein [Deltaproteobacteria bacterium]
MSDRGKPVRPHRRLTPEERLDLAEQLHHRAMSDPALTPDQRRELHRKATNLERITIYKLWATDPPKNFDWPYGSHGWPNRRL